MKKIILRSIGIYLNLLARISPKKAGEKGFRIFCTPFGGKLKKHHLDFLAGASSTNYNFNGTNIKVYQWGHGPKNVLFMHGWQSHSFRWKKYIEKLPLSEYTIIAYDAPGHGLSSGKQFTVPLNAYLLSKLVKKYNGFETVVSHSIGSMSVLYALAQYPHLSIGKIVSMATPGKVDDFLTFYQESLGLNARTFQLIKNEFQMYVKLDLEFIEASLFAKNIHIPGLIIHDKDDLETPYINAEALSKSWKNSSLVSTKGLGHNLRSPKIIELVTDYIEKNAVTIENIEAVEEPFLE
ncbi:alpha/beta hydrolase [Marivirga sp. S37H4]|uniref:Alpha/beta hydrolase n=1 Tax=Marivirga aurantiaca TaxID=2802615 RepID=A0A935CAJ2_9BACT|nr:alpha/beta hydrolase [Marivirga aurantiaca]MBK6266574.1 alpha/beta hydrolase [Marivirga aurantiaca]